MLPSRHADMEGVRMKLLDEYKLFVQNSQYTPRDSAFFTLLSNRFSQSGKPVLRGYFVTLMGRYLEAECGQSIPLPKYVLQKVLPFVSEVLMVVMYYDNQILDRKAGVNTHERVCDNLLQGNILLSELYNYVEMRIRNPSIQKLITKLIRKVYEIVCIGQQIECSHNMYANWKYDLVAPLYYPNLPYDKSAITNVIKNIHQEVGFDIKRKKRPFVRMYVHRIYLTNAYLFVRFSSLLSDFMPGMSKQALLKVQHFAAYAGMALQIMNDVIDFVPTGYNRGSQAKTDEDALSDLKNRNITLPLIFHLVSTNNGIIYQFLEESMATENEITASNDILFTREILDSNAIEAAKNISVITKRLALSHINKLNPEFPFLKDLLSIVQGSAGINTLKKIRKRKEDKLSSTSKID